MVSTNMASMSRLFCLLLVGMQMLSHCTASEGLPDMAELKGLEYISAEELHQATTASHSDNNNNDNKPPLSIHPINTYGVNVAAQEHTNVSTAEVADGAVDPHTQKHAPGGGAVSSYAGINGAILYHYGPVMGQGKHVNVYYVYYGNWANLRYSNSKTRATLTSLAQGIGNTWWWKNIESRYTTDFSLGYSPVTYKGSVFYNGYYYGHTLTNSQIQLLARNAALSKYFGRKVDPNGVYFVITDNTVTISGFCTKHCGWHTYDKYNMKYSFIGNPVTRCPRSCGFLTSSTAPNDWAGDTMASVLAHELMEAHSDPRINAYYDANKQENADKCAYTYGNVYSYAGKRYNTYISGKRFLIQQNWDWYHGDNRNAASSCRITLR